LRPLPRRATARTCLALLLVALSPAAFGASGDLPIGRAEFTDRREPPAWRELTPQQRAAFDLGLQVFNTSWVAAGTRDAPRIDGLGPLFVNGSCDSCHNNGARGHAGAAADGLPGSFVMQVAGSGRQLYGNVLNTAAIPGHVPEGQVRTTSDRPRFGT